MTKKTATKKKPKKTSLEQIADGRDSKGRFIKGISGNPVGKLPGTKNQITALRENTELALREYLNSDTNRKKAITAIDRCMNIAIAGDDKQAIAALKLLFDKILPNARGVTEQEETGNKRPVAITIVNQTSDRATSPIRAIDVEWEEIE